MTTLHDRGRERPFGAPENALRSSARVVALMLLPSPLASCRTGAVKRLFIFGLVAVGCVPAPRGAIDLHRAETRRINLALESARSTICPGEAVGLDVTLDVVVDGEDELTRLVPKRHVIDDYLFDVHQLHLSSPQGAFDREGLFHPDADAMTSVRTGFVFFARPPRGPALSVRYPPTYECGGIVGTDGARGSEGRVGDEGVSGATPNLSLHGGPGGRGGEGARGPRINVALTWVRTPDYTKLLAARAEGEGVVGSGLSLVAPGGSLRIQARGGPGGRGGRGGEGTRGWSDGEPGGIGGQGGAGGDGGPGGEVEVLLDDRFADELETLVVIDVRGGAAGEGGLGGLGGPGAEGRPVRNGRGRVVAREPAGAPGPEGARGSIGRDGPGGASHVSAAPSAAVLARFQGLGAIVPL